MIPEVTEAVVDMRLKMMIGGPQGTLPLIGTTAATQEYTRLRQKGYGHQEAAVVGAATGGAEAILEKTAIDKLFAIKALSTNAVFKLNMVQKIGKVLTAAAPEFVEEFTQGVLGQFEE